MRTPREILLNRHRAAEPKLDAVRRAVVGPLNAPRSSRVVFWLLCLPRNFWREVILPARRVWTGLAAAWVLILIANLDFHAGTHQIAASVSPNAAGFLIALHEPEQVMGDFSQGPLPPKPEVPKPPAAPPPRSERRTPFRMI